MYKHLSSTNSRSFRDCQDNICDAVMEEKRSPVGGYKGPEYLAVKSAAPEQGGVLRSSNLEKNRVQSSTYHSPHIIISGEIRDLNIITTYFSTPFINTYINFNANEVDSL